MAKLALVHNEEANQVVDIRIRPSSAAKRRSEAPASTELDLKAKKSGQSGELEGELPAAKLKHEKLTAKTQTDVPKPAAGSPTETRLD